MDRKRIAVFVGSARKGSYNRMMAAELARLAPETLALEIVDISGLTIYNQDLDENPPAAWADFRKRVKGCDGVLFVTPEYNRSMPPLLKNAIDVGSRPDEDSVWNGKPGAVVSVSSGKLGAFGANHHLRQVMVHLNVPMMQAPEAYIGPASKIFDGSGAISDASVKEFMRKFMEAYAGWVMRLTGGMK